MHCPSCDRTIPTDSKYCIYCSQPLSLPETAVETKPAIGPTQRLDPAYSMPKPADVAPSAQPATVLVTPPARAPRVRKQPRRRAPTGAVWLIGLGLLFLTGTFWPGILVLIGLSSFIEQDARGKRDKGLSSLVFFAGLAVLFASGFFWPGILLLFGLMWLLDRGHKRHGWTC